MMFDSLRMRRDTGLNEALRASAGSVLVRGGPEAALAGAFLPTGFLPAVFLTVGAFFFGAASKLSSP